MGRARCGYGGDTRGVADRARGQLALLPESCPRAALDSGELSDDDDRHAESHLESVDVEQQHSFPAERDSDDNDDGHLDAEDKLGHHGVGNDEQHDKPSLGLLRVSPGTAPT